jgi:hypothetical protein
MCQSGHEETDPDESQSARRAFVTRSRHTFHDERAFVATAAAGALNRYLVSLSSGSNYKERRRSSGSREAPAFLARLAVDWPLIDS